VVLKHININHYGNVSKKSKVHWIARVFRKF